MARKRKAFKADYSRLFDDPSALFGPETRVTLWPNGEPAIWLTDRNGYTGIEIKFSVGNAGAGVELRHFVGTPVLSVTPLDLRAGRDLPAEADHFDATHVSLTQHYPDAYAQAFKAWYTSDVIAGTHAHSAPYPADIGLTPIEPSAR